MASRRIRGGGNPKRGDTTDLKERYGRFPDVKQRWG